ncbi:chloride channel protein [Haladaptatus sp. T7]|uniref:chloride channel protein n=1 Tax=Haladaptatus sp. T7 TaxID=2029368 RepID=UPI0021A256AE|nr:chloride channel protein [Haladaptatus sp. T7]GKZ13100.1 chloride channel protein [Haladaptatus sp. T7]
MGGGDGSEEAASDESMLGKVRSPLSPHSLRSLPADSDLRMVVLALAIGIIAGLGAVFFRFAIWVVQEVFYGPALNPGSVEFALVPVPNAFSILSALGPVRLLLLPAVGGLIVGVIIKLTTPEVKGHGVPKVLESILVRGGEIDPKISVYKTVASSIAIGSGGSLGREGPIVQIGSAAGSFFGRYVDRSAYTRTLVAAGAAAGIAGTFNAPLAGVMFSLEILLAEYYLQNVIAIVLSAVMATAVARSLLDFTPNPGVREFLVPIQYHLVSPVVEYPLYVLLGVLVALVGAGVVKLLYRTEHVFEGFDLPPVTKPALGGALLGLSALVTAVAFGVSPLRGATWLFGVGYGTIRHSILGDFGFVLLLVLALMKAVGFSLSVGSGSSGGVFSPSLYIGAMLGGAYGAVVHALVPGTAGPGAYALVGMGGIFATSARAPLTATLIIFELTGQYTIILPLLLVCVLGNELSNRLLRGSTIYIEKLRERGITVQERRIGSLEDLTASDVMTTTVDTLPAELSVEDAIPTIRTSDHGGFPVVDSEGNLAGIVTLTDLEPFMSGRAGGETERPEAEQTVGDVCTTDVRTVTPGENLLSVVDKMESFDIGRLPVVEDGGVVGIVTRSDVLDAYDRMPSFV